MNKIIYYPAININSLQWLANNILYYDKIYTITPESTLQDPSIFPAKYRDLLTDGIVSTVLPGHYSELEEFSDSFITYLEKRFNNEQGYFHNENSNREYQRFYIHPEKLYGEKLTKYLKENKLTQKSNFYEGWHEIHPQIAREYMYLLASNIGEIEDATPATDEHRHFKALLTNDKYMHDEETKKSFIIEELLEEIIPVISGEIDFIKLRNFRDRNADDLEKFRNVITKNSDYLYSGIGDNDYIERRNDAIKEMKEEAQKIDGILKKSFGKNLFSWSSLSVLASINVNQEKIIDFLLHDYQQIGGNILSTIPLMLLDSYNDLRNAKKNNKLTYIFELDKITR